MQPRDLHRPRSKPSNACYSYGAGLLLIVVLTIVLQRNRAVTQPPPSAVEDLPAVSKHAVALPRSGSAAMPDRKSPMAASAVPRPIIEPQLNRPQPRSPAPARSTTDASICESAVEPKLQPLYAAAPPRCSSGGGRHRCACAQPGLVVLRAEATGRYLTTFLGGGEVFAIGTLGRMPLHRLAFRVVPGGADSPWMALHHVASGTQLVMLPKGAPQGGFMLLSKKPGEVAEGDATARFCAEKEHVFAAGVGGFLNLRKQGKHLVLLRGHGDDGPRPAGRLAGGRITLLTVTQEELDADEARWRCEVQLPRLRSSPEAPRPPSADGSGLGVEGPRAEGGEGGLRVLTYATKSTPMLCDSLRVALLWSMPLTLLGFGEEYRGNYQKLRGARAHVASLPPRTLVLFADAYDVLYGASGAALRRRFDELRVPAERVLFMAEKGCWPDWDMAFGRDFCLHRYPRSRTPYRFVNSGVWMGRAEAAYALLTELQAFTPGLDDQHVTGHMFIDRPEAFALDYNSTLFQSLQGDGVGSPAVVQWKRGAVRNQATGSSPLVMHFNGGSKPKFNSFRDHLLRAAPRKCLPRDATVETDKGPLPLERICPGWRASAPRMVCS